MPPKVKIFRANKLIAEAEGIIGEPIRDRIKALDIFLDAPCGGRGRCGKCLVRLSPDGEQVKACQTLIDGDLEIYLPDEMKMNIAGAEVKQKSVSYQGQLGVAIDIGTTTVVAHLTELSTCKRLETASGVNEQRAHGADVVNRIAYCINNGHKELTRLIREQLSDLIRQTCTASGAKPEDIHYISIAGNTIMQHIAADYSPVGMGIAPFTPVSLFGEEQPAGSDFPVAKDAVVYYAPCVASYVGGDITAGMLACGLEEKVRPCLFIDIGTNGEMTLKIGERYYCCATAAGPAFEGAEITKGMAAVSGAINHVLWGDRGLSYTTIGDAKPLGICGSGLVDTLAVMLKIGAVDETGRLLDAGEVPAGIAGLIGKVEGKNVFYLSKENEIYMTALDVRKLQLAKAAISGGIDTLIQTAGISAEDISEFFIAGGFGSYLDKVSAATMGLFPKNLLAVAKTMGNTAGEGAAIALCSKSARETLSSIRNKCEYIELSTSSIFHDLFIDNMMFND